MAASTGSTSTWPICSIPGERSHVVDYLTGHGWQVSARNPGQRVFADYGRDFPDIEDCRRCAIRWPSSRHESRRTVMARTDGDTWDLASSVGATATGVAASRALASKQPDPLINDPFADALVKAVGLEHCNQDRRRRTRLRQTIRSSTASRCVSRSPCARGSSTTSSSARQRRAFGRRSSWPRASTLGPTGCRGRRSGRCSRSTSHRSSSSSPLRWPSLGATSRGRSRRPVAIDLRDDWPEALRDSGFDPTTAHGLDRRGTADLPAARCAGPLVRQHHRAQRAGQPAGDRAHGHQGLSRRMDREAQ